MRTIKETMNSYVKGVATGDIATLKELIHKDAVMSGDLHTNKFVSESLERFFSVIEGNRVASDYKFDVKVIEEVESIAIVKLDEENFMGANFSNYFQLQKFEDKWFITSKLFTSIA